MKSIASNIIQETELLEKLEWTEVRKQIEILYTLLPDEVLNIPIFEIKKINYFSGFILLGYMKGLTTLCEEYNKTRNGGTIHLLATLNAYIGILIEIIYFYKGDLIKLSANEFLVMWKIQDRMPHEKARQEAFACALTIKNNLGNFTTEYDIKISLKLFIGHGGLTFNIIGEGPKDYFLLGDPLEEAHNLLDDAEFDEILIDPKILKDFPKHEYHVEKDGEFVRLLDIIYNAKDTIAFRQKASILTNLCKKHEYARDAIRSTKFDNQSTPPPMIQPLVRHIPNKFTNKNVPIKIIYLHLRDFVTSRIYDQTDNNAPIDDISGSCTAILEYIYLIPEAAATPQFIDVIDEAYKIISKTVFNLWGIIDKLYFIDNAVVAVVYFGFKGARNYLSYQYALKAAAKIFKQLQSCKNLKNFSISIAEAQIYTVAVGHPMRREYLTIGYIFSKLLQIVKKHQRKITCDLKTYKKAKLSSEHFKLLPTKDLDVDCIFEFKDFLKEFTNKELWHCFIGRQVEIDLILNVIFNPIDIGEYYGICLYSKSHMGKSTLLKNAYGKIKAENLTITSIILPEGPQRPYFCISHLYKQMYNMKSRLNAEDIKLVKDLPMEFWDCTDSFQNNKPDKQFMFRRKVNMLKVLRELVSLGTHVMTVVFIDNIQYIDIQSLEILQILLNERSLRLICAGTFLEEPAIDIKWKISLCDKIKIIELKDITFELIGNLCCHILKVQAVPVILCKFIEGFCGGNPGLIKLTLNNLVKKGIVQKLPMDYEMNLNKSDYIINDDQTSNDNLTYSQKLCVSFLKERLPEQIFTFQSIYYDTLLSFSTNEQSVITTSAVLGPIFKRSILKQLLDNPPDAFLALTMLHLFEAEVYDCASKYFMNNSFMMKRINCSCCLDENTMNALNKEVGYSLPKYAYCELIYFKNKYMKKLVYDVIEKNERDQLHLQMSNILEEQNMCCTLCQNNNFICTFGPQKFKHFLWEFNEPHIIYTSENECSDLMKQPDYIKDIIRKHVKKSTEEEEINNELEINIENKLGKKLKIWDPRACFCIDFLLRTYSNLIENSENAGHLSKKIFFLIQYASILISLTEYNEAHNLLKETEKLCTQENLSKSKFVISISFANILKAKVKKLLAEISFRQENLDQAKELMAKCLKLFHIQNDIVIASTQSILNKILSKTILRKTSNLKTPNTTLKSSALKMELASCFNLTSRILAAEDQAEMSMLACMQSLLALNNEKINMPLVCAVHVNAFNICTNEGNNYISDILVRIASYIFMQNKKRWDLQDVFAASMLAAKMFEIKLLNGEINNCLEIGYRVIDLCKKINANQLVAKVSSILASALLYVQRIKDAVELMKYLFNLGKTTDASFLLYYYTFCLELFIETNFTLETIDKCLRYAEEYFLDQDFKQMYSDSENKLLILLFTYFLRHSQYNEAMKWKGKIAECKIESPSFIAASNVFRYTECLLISIARSITDAKNSLSESKMFKSYYKTCETISTRWNIFLPRYNHYKAYFNLLKDRRRQSKKCLKEGMTVAEEQGNILEYCWLIRSENAWKNFHFSNEPKIIDWNLACTFTPAQWSHIMYNLPSYG